MAVVPHLAESCSLERLRSFGGKRKASVVVTIATHIYEVRPRKDKPGVDLISDAMPFGRLWLLYLVESQNATTFCSGFLSFNC